jgi:hypothetical protein
MKAALLKDATIVTFEIDPSLAKIRCRRCCSPELTARRSPLALDGSCFGRY